MKSMFTNKLPVLALRETVSFPGMIVPLFVGRQKSLLALEAAALNGNRLLLVAQKEVSADDPGVADLYTVGVLAQVIQVLKLQDNTVKVLVEGKQRVIISKYFDDNKFYEAKVKSFPVDASLEKPDEIIALRRAIMDEYEKYVQLNTKLNVESINVLHAISEIEKFADSISAQIFTRVPLKQEILEAETIQKKLEKILGCLQVEIELLNTESRIKNRVKLQIEKNQKDYFLNEQLKAIHKELGEEDYKDESNDLQKKAEKLNLTKEAKEKLDSEIKKLKMMNPMSSEATVIRNYIDWILTLPWKDNSALNQDLKSAEKVLDQDHFGLDKVKERIIEYLAVNLRTNQLKSPIICLVGPPGVGKTSLVKSIAKATGREYIKVSLGGLRDEAEIKGHRRTYLGALPGKIIQGMKKAKKSNPVMLLDEIDKMSFDYRGDPSSAMLEVLDPEQNTMFNDHYLEVDYDLSQVMFVATANSYDGIPRPLLDRMEIINLPGYTEEEKLKIASNHLLPREIQAHGLKKGELSVSKETLLEVIRYYTREAGVRTLDKNIAKLCRKTVKNLMTGDKKSLSITLKNIKNFLGVRKYTFGQIESENLVGITNGLAYSEVGGDLLAIEALLLYGKGGDVRITGKLGEVMKESAQAALSYIRFRAKDYGIKPNIFKNKDIHIHVPEGATPKDGPSAGVAMCTSIVSALTQVPVRKDVAMTGEITLRGRVLPIGGLKEKLLAGLRGGVKKVLIPMENVKDLEDIPSNVKDALKIIPVENIDEVLKHALTKKLTPIDWDEEEETRIIAAKQAELSRLAN
jgi:ATP-dependent Lon protease